MIGLSFPILEDATGTARVAAEYVGSAGGCGFSRGCRLSRTGVGFTGGCVGSEGGAIGSWFRKRAVRKAVGGSSCKISGRNSGLRSSCDIRASSRIFAQRKVLLLSLKR